MTKQTLSSLVLQGTFVWMAACNCGDRNGDATAAQGEAPTVLAKVGDETITAEEFEAYLKFKRIPIRSEEQLEKELQTFVEREALAQATLKGDILDAAAIQAETDVFRQEMLQSRYFETFLPTAVTREAVERYYKEHEEDYSTERVRVAHILVRSKRQASEDERAEKREKIDEAYAQLQAGKPFAEVAKVFSDDRVSGNRGGDMGWIQKGAIDPRFSEVAFSLAQEAHSEPVETPFGFHIIKVLEGPDVRRKAISAVEGDIRHKLRAEAKAAEVERLRSSVPYEVTRGEWMPSQQARVAPAPSQSASRLARATPESGGSTPASEDAAVPTAAGEAETKTAGRGTTQAEPTPQEVEKVPAADGESAEEEGQGG